MSADPRLPRWSEDGSEAPAELRQWLRASREQLGARDEVLQLSRGLEARLGVEAGLVGSHAPGVTATSKAWLAAGRWALWLSVGAGSVAAVWSLQPEKSAQLSTAQPSIAQPPVRESEGVPPSSAPTPPSSVNVLEPPVLLPAAEPAPASASERRAHARARAPRTSETELLQRAQRALVDRPSQALALAAEHRRLFAEGALAEEREVIAIEALRRLGRERAAQQRAARFDAKYPNSVHRSRVQATPAGR